MDQESPRVGYSDYWRAEGDFRRCCNGFAMSHRVDFDETSQDVFLSSVFRASVSELAGSKAHVLILVI